MSTKQFYNIDVLGSPQYCKSIVTNQKSHQEMRDVTSLYFTLLALNTPDGGVSLG